jgi:ankyrin repeat protein
MDTALVIETIVGRYNAGKSKRTMTSDNLNLALRVTFFVLFSFICSDSFGQTWFKAFEDRDYVALQRHIDKGRNIDRVNDQGVFALWLATTKADTVMMKFLLGNGANPNFSTKKSSAPLVFCAQEGNMTPARILIAYNANVEFTQNLHKLSPMRQAVQNG